MTISSPITSSKSTSTNAIDPPPSSSSSSSCYFPINKDAPILSKELATKCVLLGQKRIKRSLVYNLILQNNNNNVVDSTSSTTNNNIVKTIKHSDIVLGSCIGQGSFSNVYNVKTLLKQSREEDEQSEQEEEEEEVSTTTLESSSASLSLSSSSSSSSSFDADNIVIKVLRKKLVNTPRMFAACVGDLMKESIILRTLNHKNIVGLHAVAEGDSIDVYKSGHHDAFFIVLDKLSETLSDRIKRWQTLQQQSTSFKKGPSSIGKKLLKLLTMKNHRKNSASSKKTSSNKKGFLRNDTVRIEELQQHQQQSLEQAQASMQLAEALKYIHSKGMIHRDIKPDNIGFDSTTGELKLFDFDVARMLPSSEDTEDVDEEIMLFKMTKRIGSPRYMSPECGLGLKYNAKTDVYSYGLVIYEIYALTKPYDDLPSDQHDKLVFIQGERPSFMMSNSNNKKQQQSSVPSTSLQILLERCWSSTIAVRPTMEEIVYQLKVIQQQQDESSSSSAASNNGCDLLVLSNEEEENDDRRLSSMEQMKSSWGSLSGRTTATTIITINQ